jgi:glycosyltransferase involved in cell wall biosynthesis
VRALFYTAEDHWSGSARATFHTARALVARGHEVVIACCAGSPIEKCCNETGTETLPIGGRGSGVASTFDLRRVLRERDVDVSVVHAERDQLVLASAIRFAQRGVVVRRVPPFQEVALGRSGRLALKLAPAALIVSSQREAESPPTGGWRLPPFVVPLGVASTVRSTPARAFRAEAAIAEDAVLIVCPYEPAARSRLATLFRALRLIAPRHPGIRALVVGRGAEDEELRMHASALGVSRLVHFMAERVDIRPIVAAADIGWVVAAGDAGALDCLTFMEFGVPIVAERSPLTQHYAADSVTGLLLAPAEPAYHASSVTALLANPELRTTMGQAGRSRAEREFSWSAMADALERAVVATAEAGLKRA